MARNDRGRGGSDPPEGGAAEAGRLNRRESRRRSAMSGFTGDPRTDGPETARGSPPNRAPGSLSRGRSFPPRGAVRHCAGVGRDPRLARVTNAGGDARRSSFFMPRNGAAASELDPNSQLNRGWAGLLPALDLWVVVLSGVRGQFVAEIRMGDRDQTLGPLAQALTE